MNRFRDLFFISSIKSKKYCDVIPPPVRRVSRLADKEVNTIDFGYSPLSSREHLELTDNEMDLWLRASSSQAAVRARLVVTPVLRSCSSSDVWWTSCSGGRGRAGPCVRRDLLCDGIVNCGAGEEAEERCVSRVREGEAGPGAWFLPSLVTLVCSGIFITGLMLFCCTIINRDKIRTSFHRSRPDSAARQVTASAPRLETELEDRPPSYAEAIMLPRP